MAIAKVRGIGKKRSGFDIKMIFVQLYSGKVSIFHENNTIRSSIVRYIDDF